MLILQCCLPFYSLVHNMNSPLSSNGPLNDNVKVYCNKIYSNIKLDITGTELFIHTFLLLMSFIQCHSPRGDAVIYHNKTS